MRVVVDRLSKTFTDRRGRSMVALGEVHFSVEPQEFVALLGPSGCGKSTLLSIIAGLLPATSGRVYFEGERREGRPMAAMVFQEFALFPWRTVRANVEFGLEEVGVSGLERNERARHYLDMTGLAGFESKYPHQLSGGMRQRVGIARALAVEPAVLLLDEPFSALDAQTRALMMEELLAIWTRTRQSILYVTHNIQEAVFMADRVIVLSRRPGEVLDTVPIRLPRPRGEHQQGDPAFIQASDRIWGLIKSQAQAALLEGDPAAEGG
jgi:NitT/TauT family transport system ATP-binding protein